jgi:hypothetical protein
VVGGALVGGAVVGGAVVGGALVGGALVGAAVAGAAVVGGCVVDVVDELVVVLDDEVVGVSVLSSPLSSERARAPTAPISTTARTTSAPMSQR